ncbi:MAG: hypothetical protein KL787_05040, partial [Taibaiella sp.]|nr:hypothetical protein [Taibaiella sp.]
WLVTFSYVNYEYHAFHITEDGIEPKVISTTSNPNAGVGQLMISPDGTKIANGAYGYSYVELGSFDNLTGAVSDLMAIDFPSFSSAYGCIFSPGSTKLYAGTAGTTIQFDLDYWPSETDIESSAYSFSFFQFIPSVQGSY